MKISDIPISLYIHTPWCLHKCPYCDFNSHEKKGAIDEAAYISALIEDFKTQSPLLQEREIHSIFIGGGTPSLLSPKSYHTLLSTLKKIATIPAGTEITMEANPGTLEQARFQGYREAGINRLSIGVQSFQDEKLKKLQRIHNADEAKNAIQSAINAGFDNLNIDLMFGLPNQSIEDGLFDLQTAIDLNPSHISWYQLTLEPHTLFYYQPPQLPDDDKIWDLQLQGQSLLAKNNFDQYEISAYAKADRQCQHNRNYWLYGDYIGIGAGAHGKITNFDKQNIIRRWNVKNPKDYLNNSKEKLGGEQTVKEKDRPLEFMMNTLRLKESIPLALFETRTGLSAQTIQPAIEQAISLHLLELESNHLTVTLKGQQYLNELLALF